MPVLPVTDPVLIFTIVMGIIVVAPLLMARLRVPGLVGLILFGAIVGPSVLGLLERDATFELLGTVGLLYLMFTAGVSLDLAQFAKLRGRSITFGAISFFIPQLLALGVGVYLLGWGLPAALLLGSIVGSHTLLAYPIADRLGITEGKPMIMAMGATMVTDILSLLILAIVIASIGGDTSAAFWGQFALGVGVWAAAAVVLLPRAGTWFFRNVRQGPALDFGFLMVVLFLTAWLAAVAGLASIIGAFLAGLLMNRLVPAQSPLMTRIKFVGDALFIPFFLISVGMLVDVGVLFSSLGLWGLALVFTALVVVGKTAAAKAAQALYKYTPEAGWAVAGLTIPQAAATLAVTLVGFEVGLFDETAVNAVVVMILLTSLLGPSLVERFGRALALQEQAAAPEAGSAPQRLLVPLANPETAPALMDLALAVRDPAANQPVYPLAVARAGYEEGEAVAAAERLLGHAVVYAASADTPVVPMTRVDHNVARGISRAVLEQRISTVIIGWNGESSARSMVFGTVLDQFLDESRALVFVSRLVHPIASTKRVVVLVPPYAEREPGFGQALAAVKALAARAGARLLVVGLRSAAESLERWARRTGPEAEVRVHALEAWGEAVEALDGVARAGDLLCLLSVRRGTVAWRPGLLRLPRLIASRFPDYDFITAYLSEQETELLAASAAAPGPRASDFPAFPEAHVTLGLRAGALEGALRAVLAPAFPDLPLRAEEVASRLAAGQEDYAPELAAGVALYHLHTSETEGSQLFLGVSPEGLALPRTSGPVHAVFVLIAPRTMRTDRYLRQLALTAHFAHREGVVEALLRAETPAEARAVVIEQNLPEASALPPSPGAAPGDGADGDTRALASPDPTPLPGRAGGGAELDLAPIAPDADVPEPTAPPEGEEGPARGDGAP